MLLTEFIDNSIQATDANDNGSKRNVDVSFYLDAQKPNSGLSYIAITDNGCGMDTDKITKFATFALSQKDRGHVVESGKSMIGKFGVGAKQAGFYLGDRISVITKSKGDTNVNLHWIQQNLKQKRGGGQVFSGEMFSEKDGPGKILSSGSIL